MDVVKFFLSCARFFKSFHRYEVKSKILNLAILHRLAMVTYVHQLEPLPLIWFCNQVHSPTSIAQHRSGYFPSYDLIHCFLG